MDDRLQYTWRRRQRRMAVRHGLPRSLPWKENIYRLCATAKVVSEGTNKYGGAVGSCREHCTDGHLYMGN